MRCRRITPEEYEAIGEATRRTLAAIFRFPARMEDRLVRRLAAGTVHPLLLGVETSDGELVCTSRLERDPAGWRIAMENAEDADKATVHEPREALLAAVVAECRRASVRAFVIQSRKNAAPELAPKAFVDDPLDWTPVTLGAAGLTADAPHRIQSYDIALVRTRGALAAAPGWETLEPDNLPASVKHHAEPKARFAYRIRGDTVTAIRLSDGKQDGRLKHLHGPGDDGLGATRDALAVLGTWGCSRVWVRKPFARSVIEGATDDLEVDACERESVRWWTAR